MEKDEVKIMAV